MENFTQKRFQNTHLSSLSSSLRKNILILSILCIALFCGQLVNAQNTPLIGPANGGNFELGNTLAINNWTVDAGRSTARANWASNTGATAGFTGTYCGYVSDTWNAGTPPAHTYNTAQAYRSHIYRNFTVPAGETLINLSFSYISNGEAGQDYLRVWLLASGTNPATNVALIAGGSIPTGNILLATYQGVNTWTTANFTIDPLYANTTSRLVFEWVSLNTIGGAQPPGGVDNVVLTSEVPNNDCSGAVALTVNNSLTCTTTTTGTTISASQSLAGCSGTADDDVWYKFVATGSSHTIDVTPSGGTALSDAVFQVYSSAGTCASIASIACVNATVGAAAETTTLTGLTPGNTYYVRVHSAGTASGNGTFDICVKTPCVAPSQASAFTPGTVTETAFPASFTGSSASGYLVIQSTSATPPSQPANGTLYTDTASIAGLGAGLTFIQSSNATSIPGTSPVLVGNTRYYYYIYAYNNTSCGGGPTYTTGGALSGNAVTCVGIPTSVTAGSITNTGFTLSWAAPVGGSASATTYTVQVTSDAGYTTNVASSPYTGIAGLSQVVTGLSPSTLYYYRILANNGCSSIYVTGSFTTTNVAVCVPASSNCSLSNPSDMDMITNITINSLNNSSTCSASGYGVYPAVGAQTTSLLKGSTYTLSMTVGTGTGTHGAGVWFDFNQNGLFTDAGEFFLISNTISPSTTSTVSITIPIGANTGNITMRIRYMFNTTVTQASNCSALTYGETEDYTVTLVTPPGCSAPTAQPTVLSLTPVNTTINGTFTASASADSYLVLVSTNSTAPASPPVNLTSYTIGSTFSAGYTVVDTDGNTSFSATALTASTLYYFYIYSMNSLCTGGPLYYTPSPLSGSATTGLPSYCTPTGNLDCSFFGAGDLDAIANVTINTLNNSSSCSAGGYTVYAATGTQTTTLLKGGAYNLSFTSDSGTTTSHSAGVWFDFNQNGSFGDPGEYYSITTSTGPNTTTTIPIYVPTTAATGTIRMRVRYYYSTAMTSGHSCTAPGTYGEAEDYTITIATPTACNATTLNCGATIAGTTVGSTNYFANGTGCSQSNFGTWYTFVGDGNQSVITLTSPGYDSKIAVASGACGSLTNITCVDDYFAGGETTSFNTTAGVTYYVFVSYFDVAGTYANIFPFSINRTCNPPYDACASITATTCGTVNSVTIPAGNGNYNNSCSGFVTYGKEQIFSFTPAVTGSYYISQSTGYGFIYYEYKLASSGCNNSGWTCINALGGAVTSNAFTLTGGVAYYIKVDPDTVTGGTVSFAIAGKVWSGVTSTDWNTASNWIPNTSIPSASDCVIIPNVTNKPIISGTNYNGLAGTLTVQPSAQLTVNSTNSITVTDKVTVNTGGTFTINNSANLVQVNNVTNSGNIVYKRDATIKLYDYVYWSSPVSNYVLNSIASPLTFTAMYKWVIPAFNVTNSNGGQGSWVYCSGDTMIQGKGYIARAPSTFTAAPSTFNGIFTGVPNNGDISFPIERGDIMTVPNGAFPAAPFAGTNGISITNLSDNWNLAGNPYPSAIRASQFLFNNNTKITGTVRLWMHGITPSTALLSNPYYTSYNFNYDPSDYFIWNFSGASCCPAAASDLFIGAGQAFFIQMLDGSRTTDNVLFTNSLRSASYDNSLFYKSTNNSTTQSTLNIENLERNRIWLDLIDGGNNTNRTLFGYIEGATMGNDNFFDCITNNSSSTQIYSLIDNSKFTIQGRALPFNEQDEVPIGIDIKVAGTCTIGIGAVDGLFDTQDIYLKDNLLNITHDLKANPYQFTAEAGIIDNRFKVVYTTNALQNPSFTFDNNVKVLVNNDVVAVSSNDLVMESVVIYNVLGQKLNTYNNINANFITLSGLHKNNTTLLLKIKLQTGETVTRKVSY